MKKLLLSSLLISTSLSAQVLPSGAQPVQGTEAINRGYPIQVNIKGCDNGTGTCAITGGGGGGSTPTGTAGSPNANVVTVQGITGGTNQNVQQPDVRADGTLSSANGSAYTVAPNNGQDTWAFYISGTAGGVVIQPQISFDGTNYTNTSAIQLAGLSTTNASTITVDGRYRIKAGGARSVRLLVTTAGTGTITVNSNLSVVPYDALSTALDGNRGTLLGGYRYQLMGTYGGTGQTANGNGTAMGPVLPNAYMFACSGTIGGGTITLQVLGPDGVTFQTVSGVSFTTLPSTIGVVMPNISGAGSSGSVTTANVRAVLAGATSPSVFCSLS